MQESKRLLAAKSLLVDSLMLSGGDSLLLLCQESLVEVAKLICRVARDMNISVDDRHFARSEFFQGTYPPAFSPERLATEAPIPTAIALLVEWSEPTTSGRLRLLGDLQSTGQPWRIASMPGVDWDTLGLAISDFPEIKSICSDVFAVLARSSSLILSSENPAGSTDILHVPVEKYCPIKSTGEISVGSWGNFPSGETFILPDPYTSRGTITLRGSFPGYVMKPDEWIRMRITDGRIVSRELEASSDILKNLFSSKFFRSSGGVKCRNSNSLAEVGIGCNRGVRRLTGRPLFDEKKLNTIHLGFGGNQQFNGPLESCLHHDVTFEGISLSAGLEQVVEEGTYVLETHAAGRQLSEFEPVSEASGLLKSHSATWEFDSQSRVLSVLYYPQRGGVSKVEIASGESAELASTILESLEKGDIEIGRSNGGSHWGGDMMRRVVAGLRGYNLLRVEGSPQES